MRNLSDDSEICIKLQEGFMCLGASGGVWLFKDDFGFFFFLNREQTQKELKTPRG